MRFVEMDIFQTLKNFEHHINLHIIEQILASIGLFTILKIMYFISLLSGKEMTMTSIENFSENYRTNFASITPGGLRSFLSNDSTEFWMVGCNCQELNFCPQGHLLNHLVVGSRSRRPWQTKIFYASIIILVITPPTGKE